MQKSPDDVRETWKEKLLFFRKKPIIICPHNFFYDYYYIYIIQGGPFLLKSRPARYKYGFEALIKIGSTIQSSGLKKTGLAFSRDTIQKS